jgi:hypothetical protein
MSIRNHLIQTAAFENTDVVLTSRKWAVDPHNLVRKDRNADLVTQTGMVVLVAVVRRVLCEWSS